MKNDLILLSRKKNNYKTRDENFYERKRMIMNKEFQGRNIEGEIKEKKVSFWQTEYEEIYARFCFDD